MATTTFAPTSASVHASETLAPTPAPTSAPTSAPTTAPTLPPTLPPTSAPTSPPTSAPSAPTSPPTSTAPSACLSATGQITVDVLVSGSIAQVTLEGQVSKDAAWNGSSFPAVTFNAFNTVNNTYPAYTVSGQMIGGTIQVTVANGGSQSTFGLGVTDNLC